MIKLLKKIILLPIKILKAIFSFFKNLFSKIFRRESKPRGLQDIAEHYFIEYGDKIMFKLEIGTNGENLTIYSSNFKTTLEKAKKRKPSETPIEAEVVERT